MTAEPAELPFADETVRARTGRGWEEWFAVLDAAPADQRSHAALARYLAALHPEVGGWWVQGVVVGYERARGMRAKHQTAAGYNASVSRTLGVPVESLYAAWAEPERRDRWLGEAGLEVTRATAARSLRARLPDGSRLSVYFSAKGEARSQVTVDQTHLAEAEGVEEAKGFWRARLASLQELLEGPA